MIMQAENKQCTIKLTCGSATSNLYFNIATLYPYLRKKLFCKQSPPDSIVFFVLEAILYQQEVSLWQDIEYLKSMNVHIYSQVYILTPYTEKTDNWTVWDNYIIFEFFYFESRHHYSKHFNYI